MKENGKMIKEMEMKNFVGKMDKFIKENGKTIKEMEVEN